MLGPLGTLAIDPSTTGILWNRTKPTQMFLSVGMVDELKDPHQGSESANLSSLLLAIDPWQRHCSPYIPRLRGFGAVFGTSIFVSITLKRGMVGQTTPGIADGKRAAISDAAEARSSDLCPSLDVAPGSRI